MDVGYQQGGLMPRMNLSHPEKIKCEEAAYAQHHSAKTQMNVYTSQPSYGPPPPYAPQSAFSVSSLLASGDTNNRTTNGENHQQAPSPFGQSLPSIHEALGTKEMSSYPKIYESNPPPASPNSGRKIRPYEVQQDQDRLAQNPHFPRVPASSRFPAQEGSSLRAPTTPKPMQVPYTTSLPTLHPPTAQIPAQPYQSSHQSSWSHSANTYRQSSQDPSPNTPTGSYTHYPPQHAYGVDHIPVPPASYPVSTASTVQPSYTRSWERVEAEERAPQTVKVARHGSSVYGESVKRHLENFDLESSLNEIAEGSKAMYDFSGHYSQRAHQTQRSGPLPGSTPHLNEIDEMMRQNARVHDSLSRLKEVVLTQQAALAERSKEQLLKAAMEHDAAGDDNKIGGFAGADPKKRRGKAAAPGRCHSCNRAETPEWRRGPDGARTLCNACGLHYAKLTRKMGAKAAHTGSSLRPKSPGLDSEA